MTSPNTAASARKIANYTQSISSGVTNLLTELGRVNSPTDPNGNDAVLSQLQTLTALVQDMNTRLAAVEKSIQKHDDNQTPNGDAIPEPIELEVECSEFQPVITAEYVLCPFISYACMY